MVTNSPDMAIDVATTPSGRRPLLARVLLGLTLGGVLVGIALEAIDAARTGDAFLKSGDLVFVLTFGTFPVIGYVVATRQPGNSLGWLMLGIGAVFGFTVFTDAYASYAIHGGFGGRETGALVAALSGPTWVPIVVLPATFLILLFPDGHLPSARWRWFARLLAIDLALICLAIS